MPKSTKHKKARIADFAKAKLKLGKGKQIASNATNTSISSKSIALPSQSLATDKAAPTSRRNLTLPDLLVQARHYSSSVKKEALVELQQLLISYPFLLAQHLLPLISSISHLISDPTPPLRTATISLLRYIFENLETVALKGSSTGLILFTISSLSSLDEGVRIDALKVLDLLLEKIPEEIVRGWDGGAEAVEEMKGDLQDKGVGGKVVEALLGVLRVRNPGLKVGQGGYTSAASSDLSPSSRLAVLTTLSSFLETSLSPIASTSTSTAPLPWYLSTSFATPRDYDSFVASFTSTPAFTRSVTLLTKESDYLEPFSLAFDDFSSTLDLTTLYLPTSTQSVFAIPSSISKVATATVPPASLLTLLNPTLLSSFLDSAPTAFAPPSLSSPAVASTSDSHLLTISAVVSVARELYWQELGGALQERSPEEEIERLKIRKMLVVLLGYVGVYFPFGGDELKERSSDAELKLLQLNLTFASLVSLLVLSSPPPPRRSSKTKQDLARIKSAEALKRKIDPMVEGVCNWVIAALRGEIISATHPLGLPLTSAAYSALEPTIWSLLNQSPPVITSENDEKKNGSEEMLEAVLFHFEKTGSGSESRKLAFEFLGRIVLIQDNSAYNNRFRIRDTSPSSRIGKWVLSLPKYLWELQNRDLDMSLLILSFLRKLVGQGEKGMFPAEVLSPLSSSLIPFFHLLHPARGSIPGPYVKMLKMKLAEGEDRITLMKIRKEVRGLSAGLGLGGELEAAVGRAEAGLIGLE